MDSVLQMIIYFLIGLFAGFMSGMFGVGGGSVRIPLLYAAGLPLICAFGINLLTIPLSSLIGAISHRQNINFKVARFVIIGGILGTVTGAFLTESIPTLVLAVIFFIVSVITVFGIYFDRIFPKIYRKDNTGARFIISTAFFLNLLTIMRGGSGGSLFPPFLRMIKLDMRNAIATSLFATIFTSFAGAIVFWYRGNMIWFPALCVLTGSIVGARIGSLISLKTKPEWIEIGLSIFVIILSLFVLFKALR